ncbi:MAG: cytochrome c-type biogenesis CcmF C-terminal domain-containing protein [Pseudomonadota bacterium]|nr:cytochrome c-type biogenesis CcmF C-terminal domain-containing protein [Pseudomonadota bacterium]
MIIELGHFALIFSFILGCSESTFAVAAGATKSSNYYDFAGFLAKCMFSCLLLALSALVIGFLSDNFSVIYIAANSNESLPIFYKFCALWGGAEGSLLVMTFILACWKIGVYSSRNDLPIELKSYMCSVLAIINFTFLALLVFCINPFERSLPNFPLDGRGLNSSLLDFSMVIHPLFIYLGLMGLAIPYAFSLSTLIMKKMDIAWLYWLKKNLYLSWTFLSLGLLLGCWWAYRSVGWGGIWFWDPIESSTMLPWIVATALIHALIYATRTSSFKPVVAFLSITSFLFCLLNVFFVRSGVLLSIHSFSLDNVSAIYLLAIFFVNLMLSSQLFMWRYNTLGSIPTLKIFSRESFMVLGTVVFMVIVFTILLGTVYPLVIEICFKNRITVGATYFNKTLFPFAMLMLTLMLVAPHLTFKSNKACNKHVLITFALITCIFLSCFFHFGWFFDLKFAFEFYLLLLFFASLLLSVISNTKFQNGKVCFGENLNWFMLIGHAGVGLIFLGLLVVTNFEYGGDLVLTPHKDSYFGDFKLHLNSVTYKKGSDVDVQTADVSISDRSSNMRNLYPKMKKTHISKSSLNTIAIDSSLLSDFYLALESKDQQGNWFAHFYYKPFVGFIWLGAVLSIVAVLFSLLFHAISSRLQRRYKL